MQKKKIAYFIVEINRSNSYTKSAPRKAKKLNHAVRKLWKLHRPRLGLLKAVMRTGRYANLLVKLDKKRGFHLTHGLGRDGKKMKGIEGDWQRLPSRFNSIEVSNKKDVAATDGKTRKVSSK